MTSTATLRFPNGTRTHEIANGLYINGQWEAGSDSFVVVNPATDEPLGDCASASVADALRALDAAVAAQPEWTAVAPRVRAEMMHALHDEVRRRGDSIVEAMVLESGKPIAEAQGELAITLDFMRWFAEECAHVHGSYARASRADFRIITTKVPIGPTLLITPWNFPVLLPYRKVAAALAAGCTTILKPAEETPYTCAILAEAIETVGFPPGVFNLVHSTKAAEISEALMNDARLRKVSFTGSSRVGSIMAKQGAANITSVQLELGGNGPFIILEDADLDVAVDHAMMAKFRNAGQACVAANRIIVMRPIAEEFTQRFLAKVKALKVGAGYESGVEVGPLISKRQQETITATVQELVASNAEILIGGSQVDGDGYFYEPTVLRMTSAAPEFSCSELFAPVAPIYVVDTVEEALAFANATDMGLSGYLFTRDINSAISIAERMEVGMIGVNRGIMTDPAAPFGGMKRSGTGREGGHDALDEFLETKYIALTV